MSLDPAISARCVPLVGDYPQAHRWHSPLHEADADGADAAHDQNRDAGAVLSRWGKELVQVAFILGRLDVFLARSERLCQTAYAERGRPASKKSLSADDMQCLVVLFRSLAPYTALIAPVIDAMTKLEGNNASAGHVLPALVMEHREAQKLTQRLLGARCEINVDDLEVIRRCLVGRLYTGLYQGSGGDGNADGARFVSCPERGREWSAGLRRARVPAGCGVGLRLESEHEQLLVSTCPTLPRLREEAAQTARATRRR
jgi:hypothetical protein